MKKTLLALFFVVIVICSISCSPAKESTFDSSNSSKEGGEKILIAYFSATGTTEEIAKKLANVTGGTLYEIEPEVPYTSADLNYNDSNSRATKEKNDPTSRPQFKGEVNNLEAYDYVFLGYPIWWGVAPKIMYTFLESGDFSGKKIIPFCTSGSSPIGSSATNLHSLTPSSTWDKGRRFSSSADEKTISDWVKSLGL